MAEDLESYQAGAGRLQGANAFYLKDTGVFQFYDTDWEGAALRNFIGSFIITPNFLGASGTGLSGPATLSQYYGTYIFDLATGISLASCNLPSATKGARLVLDGRSVVTDGNIIADASLVAGSMLGRDGTSLSSLNLSAAFYTVLVCVTENIWQVQEANANATERAAA